MRIFEISMLRKTFGPKSEEVTGGWKKLHDEVFHDLCSSPRIIISVIILRRIRGGKHVAHIEGK
jgi:hypothetical protein